MSGVVIVDASVLLNILDVHQFNQDRSAVVAQLDEFMNAEAHLLLPLTAIFQTGDRIADLRDGRQRRRYAKRLRETRPYKYSSFPRKRESVAAFPQEKARRYCGRPRPDSRFRGNDEYYSMGIVLCNADTSEVRPPR